VALFEKVNSTVLEDRVEVSSSKTTMEVTFSGSYGVRDGVSKGEKLGAVSTIPSGTPCSKLTKFGVI